MMSEELFVEELGGWMHQEVWHTKATKLSRKFNKLMQKKNERYDRY